MGFFKKKIEKQQTQGPALDETKIKKLSLFVTIVNHGQAEAITKMFETIGVSAQFVEHGEGTAQKEIRNILGIEDNRKSIVFSFIKKDAIPQASKELEAYFHSSPKNRGIAYTIPINSVIGMSIYNFLADAI